MCGAAAGVKENGGQALLKLSDPGMSLAGNSSGRPPLIQDDLISQFVIGATDGCRSARKPWRRLSADRLCLHPECPPSYASMRLRHSSGTRIEAPLR
jgi:hypothetical protein